MTSRDWREIAKVAEEAKRLTDGDAMTTWGLFIDLMRERADGRDVEDRAREYEYARKHETPIQFAKRKGYK